MKIAAPFDRVAEVVPLIRAGAEELYCGVWAEHWRKRNIFPNARHMFYSNLKDFNQLRAAVKIAALQRVLVYVCMNDYYSQDTIALAWRDIQEAAEAGVAGFIITDITLLYSMKRLAPQCRFVLSSLNPCFNSAMVVLCRQLGITRVVLPLSQLSMEEMQSLVESIHGQGMETEVFVNNGTVCKNVTGFCQFHRWGYRHLFPSKNRRRYSLALSTIRRISKLLPEGIRTRLGQQLWSTSWGYVQDMVSPCRQEYSLDIQRRSTAGNIPIERKSRVCLEREFARQYCILCAVDKFVQWGTDIGKVGGRGSILSHKLRDVRLARQLISTAQQKSGITALEKAGRDLYYQAYGVTCSDKSCYHQGQRE